MRTGSNAFTVREDFSLEVLQFTGNGGLQKWSATDVPFVEHAKWFPTCAYIRLAKGEDFVRRIAENSNSPHTSVV